MTVAIPPRRRLWRAASISSLLLALGSACGDDEGDTGVGVPSLEVRTATTGPEPDADGYAVAVDGGGATPIGLTDTLLVDPLPAGPHSVALEGLAGNCTVETANPASVTVVDGSTAVLEFAVVCGATTGTLLVTTATTGTALDPDGYEVSVDGAAAEPIALDGTLTVAGLSLGSHTVTLGGVADNCQVQGPNPAETEVLAATTVPVAFDVVCAAPPEPERIAFTTNAVGLLGILVVNPDGTGLVSLTPEGVFESRPVWSPDGSRLLFLDEAFDLNVMGSDGTGREPLADGTEIAEYRWSPDGTMIAYADVLASGVSTLWVMAADGGGKLLLAREAGSPSWSPDSRRIAYGSTDGGSHIRIINADGGEDRRLTPASPAAFQPAWSPAADEIAYVTLGAREILLVGAEGGEPVNLTAGRGLDESPAWSPDGSRIAFNTAPPGDPFESEIAVMQRDGGSRANLTNRPGFDFNPDWSPDGTRVVYTRGEEQGELLDSEIYAIGADGSGEINLSNRPDTDELAPDWGGSAQGGSRGARAEQRRRRDSSEE